MFLGMDRSGAEDALEAVQQHSTVPDDLELDDDDKDSSVMMVDEDFQYEDDTV